MEKQLKIYFWGSIEQFMVVSGIWPIHAYMGHICALGATLYVAPPLVGRDIPMFGAMSVVV